jgi:predicted RNA binding protein YcfA (HicA-like mRNA interferase family)
MAFSKHVWNQLKATTADELESALKRDGYTLDPASKGAIRAYIKKTPEGNSRVAIHWHPNKSYGPKLLTGLLRDSGWTEDDDLYRVGLIARPSTLANTIPTYLIPCTECDRGIVGTGSPCPICGGTGHREVSEPPNP